MTTPIQPLTAPTLSPPSSADSTYTDLNGLAALKSAPTSPEAIRAVSQQVEALFLQMMLKSMRDANAEEGEAESNETSMYQDMFDKQVALTLSKHTDLGIARLFERQLGAKAAETAPGAAAAHSSLPRTGPQAPGAHADGRSGGHPTSDAVTPQHAAQFVSAVLPTIRRAAARLGVSPMGLLAQAALETGWGKRMARTAAGTPRLKMFGITLS